MYYNKKSKSSLTCLVYLIKIVTNFYFKVKLNAKLRLLFASNSILSVKAVTLPSFALNLKSVEVRSMPCSLPVKLILLTWLSLCQEVGKIKPKENGSSLFEEFFK